MTDERISKLTEDVAYIRAAMELRLDSLEEQIKPLTRTFNFFQGLGKVLGIAALVAAIVRVFK